MKAERMRSVIICLVVAVSIASIVVFIWRYATQRSHEGGMAVVHDGTCYDVESARMMDDSGAIRATMHDGVKVSFPADAVLVEGRGCE